MIHSVQGSSDSTESLSELLRCCEEVIRRPLHEPIGVMDLIFRFDIGVPTDAGLGEGSRSLLRLGNSDPQ